MQKELRVTSSALPNAPHGTPGGGEAPRGTTSYKQFTSFSSEDVSLEPQGSELVQ